MKLRHLFIGLIGLMTTATTRGADDIAPLSDEFNHAATITNWLRIFQVEGWGNNVLQQFDVNATSPGRMFMMPYSSTWYGENRGELTFKPVTGDFVITTDVEPTRRSGSGAPQAEYSLAGIMIRSPRTMTNVTQWTPNGQNYVFLSLGAANSPGGYQFEVKTTINSGSTLHITGSAPSRAMIQVARIGPHIITLRSAIGGSWQVHRRYHRPDMPATMQAGLTVYTDWPLCAAVGFENQNTRVLTNGTRLTNGNIVNGANPDLRAAFEYVRYQRPQIPTNLVGADFSNPAAVSDAQLLSFLGTNANQAYLPQPQLKSPTDSDRNQVKTNGFPIRIQTTAGLAYALQGTTNLSDWTSVLNFSGAGAETEVFHVGATNQNFQFYRVVVTP